MIGFAAPAGLLALVALALPLAIHLLSRRRPDRVRVGSTRLLQGFVAPRARQIRLTDVPALVVRLVVIALLALLVAQPLWRPRSADDRVPARWLLVQPEVAADRANLASLEALAAEGLEPHLMAPGLPTLDFSSVPGARSVVNAWAALAEADRMVPPGSEFTVATTGAAELFRGSRPALAGTVVWRDFPTAKRWVDRAWVAGVDDGRRGDSLFVSVGTTGPEGTTYASTLVFIPSATSETVFADLSIAVSRATDGYSVRIVSDSATAVSVPASFVPGVVAVAHEPGRADDAHYVATAVATLAEELRLPLSLRVVEAADRLPSAEVLFWLSEAPLPDAGIALAEEGAVVVEDAVADQVGAPAAQTTLGAAAGLLHGVTVVVGEGSEAGVPLWWAGAHTAMSVERVGAGYRYRFAARFHHAAGNLVLRPEFPALLLALVGDHLAAGVPGVRAGGDRADSRVIPQLQRTPDQVVDRGAEPVEQPLHPGLWLLAVVFFGLERLVALRRRT